MKGTSLSRGARIEAKEGIEVPRWEVFVAINHLREGKSMVIVHVGVDLAKNVFAMRGVAGHGEPGWCDPASRGSGCAS
jgi:hypothetical protein